MGGWGGEDHRNSEQKQAQSSKGSLSTAVPCTTRLLAVGTDPPSAGVGGGDREGAERGACVWNQPSQRLPSDPKVTASGLREWRKQGQNSNGEKASLLIYRQGKDSQKPGGVLVTEPLKLPALGKVFFFFKQTKTKQNKKRPKLIQDEVPAVTSMLIGK